MFKNRCKKESCHHSGKHALCHAPLKQIPQDHGTYKGFCHPQKIKPGNLLIILADGQIEHGVKHQDQTDISAKSCKGIGYRNFSNKMFSDTKRDSQKTAENKIDHHSQIIAGTDVFIPLFVDHIGHIPGKYCIERSCRQKRKNEDVQHRTGKKFPLRVADLIKPQHGSHAGQVDDDDQHRCYRRYRTVCKP